MTTRLNSTHTTNRGGRQPEAVVIHCTDWPGGMPRDYFVSNSKQVSAHYCIFKDGSIVQYVDEGTGANHAGNIVNPTAAIVRERGSLNPNAYTIGVEHDLKAPEQMTAAQFQASQSLVRGICSRWGIPWDRRHIIGHREIRNDKTCPGWGVDMDAYVAGLGGSSGGGGSTSNLALYGLAAVLVFLLISD